MIRSPFARLCATAATFATLCWAGPPVQAGAQPRSPDPERARFTRCAGAVRVDCVVDGDTFWYRGLKIRIADINTPETATPRCPGEARLGKLATARLTQLLNAGPFTLVAADRERDRYGRLLRRVTRRGASLGETLVDEGLAEQWRGRRSAWC